MNDDLGVARSSVGSARDAGDGAAAVPRNEQLPHGRRVAAELPRSDVLGHAHRRDGVVRTVVDGAVVLPAGSPPGRRAPPRAPGSGRGRPAAGTGSRPPRGRRTAGPRARQAAPAAADVEQSPARSQRELPADRDRASRAVRRRARSRPTAARSSTRTNRPCRPSTIRVEVVADVVVLTDRGCIGPRVVAHPGPPTGGGATSSGGSGGRRPTAPRRSSVARARSFSRAGRLSPSLPAIRPDKFRGAEYGDMSPSTSRSPATYARARPSSSGCHSSVRSARGAT